MLSILLPLFLSCGIAALGTVAVRSVARRRGWVLAPRVDRWHVKPTALYGGVAIGLAAGLTVLIAAPASSFPANTAAIGVLGAAGVLFFVGLVDDARGLSPVGKFILQLGAGTILIVSGVIYPLTPWNPVNVLVTLFWFVGIVNALNLIDNMDGVAAGVAAVAATAFAALFAAAGDILLTVIALATAGAAVGFLFFNFKPASIFMGDVGSLFLGGMLAGFGAAYPLVDGVQGPAAVLVPGLILLVPILDTALVTVTRTLHNRRISAGGRDHSTHRLVEMGFSESRAALFLYACGVVAFGIATAVGALPPEAGLWLGLMFLIGSLLFAGYLGRLHRYDDGRPAERRRRGTLVRNILVKRRGLELLLDVVLFGVAYYGAFIIHNDGSISAELGAVVNGTLGIAIVLKLAAFHTFRVYRGVWDRAGLADVHRIIKATLLGAVFVGVAATVIMDEGQMSTGILVLDTLLTGTLALGARSSFGSLERFRHRLQETGDTVLICGAGPGADIVLSTLPQAERPLRALGYVDDRDDLAGTLIHGLPVLGSLRDVPALINELRPYGVVLSPDLADFRGRDAMLQACRARGVEVLQMHVELRRTNGRVNGSRPPAPDPGSSEAPPGMASVGPVLRPDPAEPAARSSRQDLGRTVTQQ